MPPVVSHMVAARRVAESLEVPSIGLEFGSYLLGSTSPDVRVLTHWERERTHFFDLNNEDEHQDSVRGFFKAHDTLKNVSKLNEMTIAWVCGFITHLIMDETYIVRIYRPRFGLRSALGGGSRANLLDRVLQYELDRREREDQVGMRLLRDALHASAVEMNAGFIDRRMLLEWRDITATMTETAPDWRRFTYVASRHLRHVGIRTEDDFKKFLTELPEMLDQSIISETLDEIDGFYEEVHERSVSEIKEYLGWH